jgi:hypothetical protein
MCRYYTIKVMHSLLEIVRLMTPTVFETAVHIVVEVRVVGRVWCDVCVVSCVVWASWVKQARRQRSTPSDL